MATTIEDIQLSIITADSNEDSIVLNPNCAYSIYHTGLAADGTTAALNPIFFKADASSVTASYAEGTNKGVVVAGQAQVFGPGITTLYFKTTAGSPMMTVIRTVNQHLAGET